MSRLLLDTTVLIDLERAGHDLESILLDEDDVAVSAVTVAELEVGIHLASEEHVDDRRESVRAVVDSVVVLPYDIEVAHGHAVLLAHSRKTGRPRGRRRPWAREWRGCSRTRPRRAAAQRRHTLPTSTELAFPSSTVRSTSFLSAVTRNREASVICFPFNCSDSR